MWYLTEELVVMALCDAGTGVEEKHAIVQALLEANRPQAFEPEAPVHKAELLDRGVSEPRLADFVGSRSWILFNTLGVDARFLEQNPSTWPTSAPFNRLSHILHNIICVNDAAECAVKDVVDYVDHSRDADRCNNAVLVVSSHRELVDFHNLTKDECAKLT